MDTVQGPVPVTDGDPAGAQFEPPEALTYPGSPAAVACGAVHPAGTVRVNREPVPYAFDPPVRGLKLNTRLLFALPTTTFVLPPLAFRVIVPDPLAAAAEAWGAMATTATNNADTSSIGFHGARDVRA
jgi:hypothetical protein